MALTGEYASAAREYGVWAIAKGAGLMGSFFAGAELTRAVTNIPGTGILDRLQNPSTEAIMSAGLTVALVLVGGVAHSRMNRAAAKLGL
jgi:hypothetical protein